MTQPRKCDERYSWRVWLTNQTYLSRTHLIGWHEKLKSWSISCIFNFDANCNARITLTLKETSFDRRVLWSEPGNVQTGTKRGVEKIQTRYNVDNNPFLHKQNTGALNAYDIYWVHDQLYRREYFVTDVLMTRDDIERSWGKTWSLNSCVLKIFGESDANTLLEYIFANGADGGNC